MACLYALMQLIPLFTKSWYLSTILSNPFFQCGIPVTNSDKCGNVVRQAFLSHKFIFFYEISKLGKPSYPIFLCEASIAAAIIGTRYQYTPEICEEYLFSPCIFCMCITIYKCIHNNTLHNHNIIIHFLIFLLQSILTIASYLGS